MNSAPVAVRPLQGRHPRVSAPKVTPAAIHVDPVRGRG